MTEGSSSNPLLNDKYHIVRALGGGGFGYVFLAEDVGIRGRKVAIKILQPNPNLDRRILRREMNILASIDHPNVVRFYHYFVEDDSVHLVMEFCERGSLTREVSTSTQLSTSQVFNWGLILCEALAAIHAVGIVHHDIKPDNILVSHDGTLKLGDFGVANRLIGTSIYLAPEMLDGSRVSAQDPRVDIYALGISLFELLAGYHPFLARSPEDALNARLSQRFLTSIPDGWAREVIAKATHPVPEQRFQNATEFAQAIRYRHVPDVFNEQHYQAHALANKSEIALARKKWATARKLALLAVQTHEYSVAALVAAGRAELRMHHLESAKNFFDRALKLDRRAHVQKELGWIKLETKWYAQAISLLTEHVHYAPDDLEAYNLLLKCYYGRRRFNAGLQLLDSIKHLTAKDDCFQANRFLLEVLASPDEAIEVCKIIKRRGIESPFTAYNLKILTEADSSFDGGFEKAHPKLLFQEYSQPTKRKSPTANEMAIYFGDEPKKTSRLPIISIGGNFSNDFVVGEGGVSRRHCAIVNLDDEVWIHDLGSTYGTFVDGEPVQGRMFLHGVHEVTLGDFKFKVASSSEMVV